MAMIASRARAATVALLVPVAAAAQGVPSGPLKPANGVVKAPFQNVTSMHEYLDGKVIMVDAMTQQLLVGDFGNGRFTKVDGIPAMPIYELPGDTVVSSGADMRWIFIAGTRPIGQLDRTNPVLQLVESHIEGADVQGHFLGMHGTTPGHGDSANVVLVDRITGIADTVTRAWMPPPMTVLAPGAAPPPPRPRPVFTQYEAARLSRDGWIAVLRREPYRTDWRMPDGKWIIGKPIAVPVIKLDDREKQAFMVRRARGGTPEPPSTITNWPETIPPWSYWLLSPLHSPDGKLLVLRTPSADYSDPRYDVINRSGELERQVTLPVGQFILGFGAKSVYVVVPHKDGQQDVERHPWP